MSEIRITRADQPYAEGGNCESGDVGREVCPDPAAFILVNSTNNGFAVMCTRHKASFFRQFPEAATVAEPYSRERKDELQGRLRAEGV